MVPVPGEQRPPALGMQASILMDGGSEVGFGPRGFSRFLEASGLALRSVIRGSSLMSSGNSVFCVCFCGGGWSFIA